MATHAHVKGQKIILASFFYEAEPIFYPVNSFFLSEVFEGYHPQMEKLPIAWECKALNH